MDKGRIVAFAYSEGAFAVANAALPEGVRGMIIAAWTCHQNQLPAAAGLGAPATMPLLAIEFERDSFLSTQGRCSEFFQGRPDAHEVILPGEGHVAGGVEAARAAVVEFLGGIR